MANKIYADQKQRLGVVETNPFSIIQRQWFEYWTEDEYQQKRAEEPQFNVRWATEEEEIQMGAKKKRELLWAEGRWS